jgi:hypothetical protein
MLCNGPIGTYFGKLLVIVVKQAKVDGILQQTAKKSTTNAVQWSQRHLFW